MSLRFRTILDSIPVYRPGGCPEERGAETAIKLSSNECPWEPPSSVVDAVSQAACTLNRYPDFYKVEAVEALAAHYGCDANRIAIDNGSGTLLQDLVRIVADQGDRVIFGTPSFAAYEIDVLLAGAVPVKVPLDDSHTYDLDAISQVADERTRMILICNPNNPTGTFLSTEQLRRFLKRTPSDILVVVDEAYHEFVTREKQEASLGLLEEFDNVVLLRTFSKAFGLAGMRIGYCLTAPETVDALNKTVAEFSVSIPAQAAALACLEPDTLSIIDNHVAEIIENRMHFEEALDEAGIDYIPSQSNFVMLPQESQTGFDTMAAGGVICRPFSDPEGIRITIGTRDDMARVARALELPWPRP
jgi:histidinol-phosphate aminotransferase